MEIISFNHVLTMVKICSVHYAKDGSGRSDDESDFSKDDETRLAPTTSHRREDTVIVATATAPESSAAVTEKDTPLLLYV